MVLFWIYSYWSQCKKSDIWRFSNAGEFQALWPKISSIPKKDTSKKAWKSKGCCRLKKDVAQSVTFSVLSGRKRAHGPFVTLKTGTFLLGCNQGIMSVIGLVIGEQNTFGQKTYQNDFTICLSSTTYTLLGFC